MKKFKRYGYRFKDQNYQDAFKFFGRDFLFKSLSAAKKDFKMIKSAVVSSNIFPFKERPIFFSVTFEDLK